jgi:type II secretory ATPase GspE/PulE/Tfp pilus assembly ATPase PilB-like protein
MAATLSELYDELRVSVGAERLRAATSGNSSDDPFILKLAQLVLSYGLQIKASDIHIEPTGVGARVRYRIDGMLHEMLKLPVESRDALIRSIKIKANLVNEALGRSKPQDGRIDLEANERKIDLRLSSFPTLYGDVLALRVFDRSAPLLTLEQVGFPPSLLKAFEQLIRRPNGMLLVTGPAGSGKTSTLYAVLNKIRSPHIKIVTLEDPVEYQVEGVDQAQMNAAIGLTFASGLRAILRQDANVILVGEIRDKETADIAIRAALTGHMVLSTIHTRNALGAAARLVDMGIEPHLIVSSVNGVMAQRLVRVLCAKCKTPDAIAQRAFVSLWTRETGAAPSAEMNLSGLSKAVGCPACSRTGYQGRVGIFELLALNDELKQLILDRATSQQFAKTGSRAMRTMMVHGLERAAQGITTVDEVLRVTGGSED